MKLSKSFVVRCLLKEQSYKPGDCVSFKHKHYELTLKREENIYAPFTFAVDGKGSYPTHQVSIGRRYQSLEKAFLHVLNGFNDNVNIRNKYKSLDQWFDE